MYTYFFVWACQPKPGLTHTPTTKALTTYPSHLALKTTFHAAHPSMSCQGKSVGLSVSLSSFLLKIQSPKIVEIVCQY